MTASTDYQLPQISHGNLLELMGIDVWVRRTSAPRPVVDPEHPAAETPAGAGRAGLAHTRALRERLADARPHSRVPAEPAPAVQAPATAPVTPASDDLAACTVLGASNEVALLLCELAGPRASRRLVRDVLASFAVAAAGKASQSAISETPFEWNPAVTGGAGISGRRALQAFVDKRLDDFAGELVLICGSLVDKLPELPQHVEARGLRCRQIPELTALLADGEAKRLLWRHVQTLKR